MASDSVSKGQIPSLDSYREEPLVLLPTWKTGTCLGPHVWIQLGPSKALITVVSE